MREALSKNNENEKPSKSGIFLLNETWLMNEETPPKIPQYEWYGSNREGETGKRARAGVGILIPEDLGQVISTKKRKRLHGGDD